MNRATLTAKIMMYIFYDFETSSRELLGQVLSYAFIVTDDQFNVVDELCGLIKLNRTQLPDIDAILINRLNITTLQQDGLSEYEAAKTLYRYLSELCDRYENLFLIGFNSNQFDLQFLRNMLIRYGFNPYFFGKLQPRDVLQYARYLAYENPQDFPWALSEDERYYSFKLETLATQFSLLSDKQTHDARDDVLLTINLAKTLETTFNCPLKHWNTFGSTDPAHPITTLPIFKQKTPFIASDDTPAQHFQYTYWLNILCKKNEYFVLNIEDYATHNDVLKAIRYINLNKRTFFVEPLTDQELQHFKPVISQASQDPWIRNFSKATYFEQIKKPWDIEYQIHEMGFNRIDLLHPLIKDLMKTPASYPLHLRQLLDQRSKSNAPQKESYVIQLYNRTYLNYHPEVPLAHFHKYIIPRYVEGSLYRNADAHISLADIAQKIHRLTSDATTSADDLALLSAYNIYFMDFCRRFSLESQLEIDPKPTTTV